MHEAILLIGPTGSGKTPLGDLLERRGLQSRACVHFDFGRELRRAAQPGQTGPSDVSDLSDPSDLSDLSDSSAHLRHSGVQNQGPLAPDEINFVRHVLKTGALLEDKDFHIARKILTAFLSRSAPLAARPAENVERQRPSCSACPATSAAGNATPAPLIVLNGLPRHVGQAADVDRLLRVVAVVHLSCTAETAFERIRINAGGDRTSRADDGLDSVRAKLALFDQRIRPLLHHYRERGARVTVVEVGVATTAEEMWQTLQEAAASGSRRAGDN